MAEGWCTAVGMKYARHAPDSSRVRLKHGRLMLNGVKAACDELQCSRLKTRCSSMSTKDLLVVRHGISKELARCVKQ
jgi:hypothetical protein